MPNEKKEPTKPRHPETTFIPPLHMILSFFKKKDQKNKPVDAEKEAEEKAVEKIIDKLNKEK